MGKPSKDKLFIGWLARAFEERRSDVTDICDEFAKNHAIPENFEFEKRFVRAHIPTIDCSVYTGFGARPGIITLEYDTLTTEISFSLDGKNFSQCVDHEYLDE